MTILKFLVVTLANKIDPDHGESVREWAIFNIQKYFGPRILKDIHDSAASLFIYLL